MKYFSKLTLILSLTLFFILGNSLLHAQQWKLYNITNSPLNHNWVLSLAQDHNGDIWVGSVGGLNKISGSTWSSYTTGNSGMPRNEVWDVKIDQSNNVWMAIPFSNALNHPGAITKFDGTSWFTYVPTNNQNYRQISIDEDQNVWIAISGYSVGGHSSVKGHLVRMTSNGVVLNVFTANNTPFPWYVSTFRSVMAQSGGIVWAGTQDAGAGKYNGTDWTIYNPQNTNNPNYNVYSIVADRTGILWMAGGAVGSFDTVNNIWTTYNLENTPMTTIAQRVAVDSLNNIWVGTLSELLKFDGQNWLRFNSSNSGLPPASPSTPGYEVIEAIMIDKWGNKWIGTRNGLAVYNESGITNINEISTVPSSFKLFQNFPNPFNPSTKIRFNLNQNGFVELKIYDMTGREVQTLISEQMTAGEYEYQFDAIGLSSGIYYYKLTDGVQSEIKKMILLK